MIRTAAVYALAAGLTPYFATEAFIGGRTYPGEVTFVRDENEGLGYAVSIDRVPGTPNGLQAFVPAEDAEFTDDGLLNVPVAILPQPERRRPTNNDLTAALAARKAVTTEVDALTVGDIAVMCAR